MNIAITGSSGLVGSALVPLLESRGHSVNKILRSKPNPYEWVPEGGEWNTAFNSGIEGIVHLAGENIAAGKWTAERKEKIRDSRILGTRNLCEHLVKLDKPPAVLVCASAIGFYGDRGTETLTEESAKGGGFLADVCEKWEAECEVAARAGMRVVNLRFGMILSSKGGALKKMLTPFKMGMGGKIGNGEQYMSWVAIDDVINAAEFALTNDSVNGPVNVTAPQPQTNSDFTKALGRALGRPTFMPMPAFGARLIFGEMADELLLSSAKVEPSKLKNAGFQFKYGDLEGALRGVLGK